jgi:hypothetical protein
MLPIMNDGSLLDQTLRFCDQVLRDMNPTAQRRQLRARLGVLERATWALPLLRATEGQLVSLAKLVMALREDVLTAKREDELFARVAESAVFLVGTARTERDDATRRDLASA